MKANSTAEELQAKQNYLHQEIIEQEYDPEQFQEFMDNQKGLNLDLYSLKELKNIVRQFKGSIIVKDDQDIQEQTYKNKNPKGQKEQAEQYRIAESQQANEPVKQQIQSKKMPSKQIQTQISQSKEPAKFISEGNNIFKVQNSKKPSINLKQMKIPQYKGPSKQKNSLFNNQSNLKLVNTKDNRSKQTQTSIDALRNDKKTRKPQITIQKDDKRFNSHKTKGVYDHEQDHHQDYDGGFIESENPGQKQAFKDQKNYSNEQQKINKLKSQTKYYDQEQGFPQRTQSHNYTQSVRQSTYIPSSQNSKSPFIIVKKTTTSSLYKMIKQQKNFIDSFQIRVTSFSKKQSSSLFKFSYITYYLETEFGPSKEKDFKNIKSGQQNQAKKWRVERRFNDFKWLHLYLRKNYVGLPIPPIPDKTKMRSFNDEHLEERMIFFERFLNKCIHIDQICSDPIIQAFLSIESREELQAVQKNFQNKLKNRDQNLLEYLKGEQILLERENHNSIDPQTKKFYEETIELQKSLNFELKQLQIHLKIASQKAVSASNIFRQLSQMHKSNPDIKASPIFDVMSEYVGQLSYKLDNEAYHLKNYISNIWMYEEKFTDNILMKINSLQKHKTILQTKFKDLYLQSSQQLSQSQSSNGSNPIISQKNIPLYKKTKQLYEINLSLTLQEISRHQNDNLRLISKEFLSGIEKYVDQIKNEMMTAVDLMTKSMTVAQGKQLKQVELIADKRGRKRSIERMGNREE